MRETSLEAWLDYKEKNNVISGNYTEFGPTIVAL